MSQPHPPYPPTPPPLPPGFAAAPLASGPPPLSALEAPFEPAYEAPNARRGKPRRQGPSAGMAAWAFAATAAIAYLSVVVLRPDLVARVNTEGPAVAEIEALRGEVDGLRRDLAEVRSTVSEAASQQKVLFERLDALNGAANAPVPAAQTGSPPPPLRLDSAPVNGPLSPRADAATPQQASEAAKKTADAKVINAKPGIETGSVKPVAPDAVAAPAPAAKPVAAAAEAPPFGAPVVTPAAKPVGVQIASGSSLDGLRLSWNLLSETHADKLKSLEPRYSLSVDNGAVVYNLMAGP